MKIAEINSKTNVPHYGIEDFNRESGGKIIRRIINNETYEPSILVEILDQEKFVNFAKTHEIGVLRMYDTPEKVVDLV